MKKIKILLLFFSLLSAFFTISLGSGALSFVFMIPLFYGVLYYILVPDDITLGPGFTMMNFVFFVRFIIFPPIFKYYSFEIDLINDHNYLPTAVYISIVEIIVILLTIKLSWNNKGTSVPIETHSINKRIPISLFLAAIAAFVIQPDVLANIHFILNPEMIIEERVEQSTDVWIKVIEWAQLFIVLFLISFLYSKYRSFLLVTVVSLIPCLFYFGHSRLSLLLPLVTTMFLIIKLFPERRKLILIIFFLFAFLSMTSLTIVKQFRVESIESIGFVSNIQPSNLINAYFGGIPNIVTGLHANDYFADKIGLNTMINDMFRNGMGFSSLFSSDDNSVYYFNHVFYGYGYDQIIPTVCQGLFYFGYFFFWIPTLIMIKLVMYSDKVYFKSSRIEYVWAFSLFSVAVGWAVPGSFQHVYMNFHNSLFPLLALGMINRVRLMKILKVTILLFPNTLKNGLKKSTHTESTPL